VSTTSRIAAILFIIFLMPVLFFSIYEINSLNEDEKAINQIYEKQLEAILFSANQYADDILNSWIAKTELLADQSSTDSMQTINNLLQLNPAIRVITKYDKTDQNLVILHQLESGEDSIKAKILDVYKQNDSLFNQLIRFKKSGYQKIEALEVGIDDLLALTYNSSNLSNEGIIYGIIIDSEIFIDEVLGPRLQFIAQDKFAIVAFSENIESPVYSTYDSTNIGDINEILTEDLWLLPNYSLGISPIGTSLQSLSKNRAQTDLILIIVLSVVLVLAVIFTFRTVRKEVRLAQNKSEFIANVSHELRTPLALISMFAETLQMGRVKDNKKRDEYYSIIHKETQRLTGIVNKILSFSQLDAGKQKIEFSKVNLSEVAAHVLSTYEFHLEKNGFEINQKLQQDVFINADKDAVAEILINLIDNAIKYSESKKIIEVTVRSNEKEAILSVRDYGIGISKTDQKYIFDKFYRSSTGDLAKKQGTGLGLALVKQLAHTHKADIKVQSELGNGSVFFIHFNKYHEHV